LEPGLVRLTDALAAGAPPASVQEAIQDRERAEIRAQLDHLEGLTRFTAAVDPSALPERRSQRPAHQPAGAP